MRTFHTVKAEEIVRIDGLNADYDFKQNTHEAAKTPAERLDDHSMRRDIAMRPVVRDELAVEREPVQDERDGELLERHVEQPVEREDVPALPPMIKFTLTGGEIKEVPENEIIVSDGIDAPSVGDYLVESYDIWTDKSLFKVYDKHTFGAIFKASLN